MSHTPKFVQIAFGASGGFAGLYALDEEGGVWVQEKRPSKELLAPDILGWSRQPDTRFSASPAVGAHPGDRT